MRYYAKRQARKYLITHGLSYDLTNSLWKQLLKTGRLFPDKGNKYSAELLDLYIAEVKPR